MIVIPIILILVGVYSIFNAITERPSFYNDPKAQTIGKIFGYNSIKIFYTILGSILIILGLIVMAIIFTEIL